MTDIREKVARALVAQMRADDPGIYALHEDCDRAELESSGTVDGYVTFTNLADAALEACGYHRMREALQTLLSEMEQMAARSDLVCDDEAIAMNAARAALEDKP